MTQTVNFTPNGSSNFTFPVTLDGNNYRGVITWSLFGLRYYLNLYDLNGNIIFTLPLIGTPLGYDLSALSVSNNIAVATTSVPHTFAVGSVVPLVISGANPAAYNGTFNCSIMSSTQFSYPLPQILGAATLPGVVNFNLSLTAGYFKSTMVYLPDSQQIVTNP